MNIELMKKVILSSASREIRNEMLELLLENLSEGTRIDGILVSYKCYNEVKECLLKDGLIGAIKTFRKETHFDLQKAKRHIDELNKSLKS